MEAAIYHPAGDDTDNAHNAGGENSIQRQDFSVPMKIILPKKTEEASGLAS